MVSPELQQSLENVFDQQPERSNMIIQSMNVMSSVNQGQDNNDVIRTFLYLDQVSTYVEQFLQRKNADPASFAPPVKPRSVSISQQDTDKFIGKTVDFSVENWNKIQQQRLLSTGFKADVSTQQDAEFKGLSVKQERIGAVNNKMFLDRTKDNLKDIQDAMLSKEAVQGAVKGFLIGGQAGAVKGYCSGAVASLAKNKRDYDFLAKCDNSAESEQKSKASTGPKRK